MQVSRGTAEGDFGKGETAQKGGNSRRIGIPLARVANKGDVGPELIAVGREEGEEARAACFFLTFDEHRETSSGSLPCSSSQARQASMKVIS
jgi:hypothetical protein